MKKDEHLKPANITRPVPVAIIGIGCLFPRANNPDAYWANIINRVDAITEVPKTHWRSSDYYEKGSRSPEPICTSRGGFISPVDFNPIEFDVPQEILEQYQKWGVVDMIFPTVFSYVDILNNCLFVLFLNILAMLYPAVKVNTYKPIEAINYV